MTRQRRLQDPFNKAIRAKLSSYAGGCKRRSIKWYLKISDAANLFLGDCSYCGRPAKESGDKNGFNGIDRIDSTRDYILDNVCSCCPRCNIIKNNMSLADLRASINRMHAYMHLWPTEFDDWSES